MFTCLHVYMFTCCNHATCTSKTSYRYELERQVKVVSTSFKALINPLFKYAYIDDRHDDTPKHRGTYPPAMALGLALEGLDY